MHWLLTYNPCAEATKPWRPTGLWGTSTCVVIIFYIQKWWSMQRERIKDYVSVTENHVVRDQKNWKMSKLTYSRSNMTKYYFLTIKIDSNFEQNRFFFLHQEVVFVSAADNSYDTIQAISMMIDYISIRINSIILLGLYLPHCRDRSRRIS